MSKQAILLDTSFFIRFLNKDDALFANANEYFKYCVQKQIRMFASTIAIAEFAVRGDVNELPLKNLQILPFNIQEAKRSGELAKIIYDKKQNKEVKFQDRKIISNDIKLFSQADVSESIVFYLSSDQESLKMFDILKATTDINFNFLNLKTPLNESHLFEQSLLFV